MMNMREKFGGLDDKMTFTLVEKYGLEKNLTPRSSSEEVHGLLKKVIEISETPRFGVEETAGIDAINQLIPEIYQTIDPGFLNIKHPNNSKITYGGFDRSSGEIVFEVTRPRFAVYSLDSPKCEVEVAIGLWGTHVSIDRRSVLQPSVSGILSKPLTSCFEIIRKKVTKDEDGEDPFYLPSHTRYSFTSKFKGIIPEDVRQTINYSKKLFGNRIYLVAEADNWKGRKVDTEDPLVIGVRGNKCFLLDEFDCTKMEHYVKSEFTT